MQTILAITLAAIAAPAAAQDQTTLLRAREAVVRHAVAERDDGQAGERERSVQQRVDERVRTERERERERERAQQQRERAERDEQRQRERAEQQSGPHQTQRTTRTLRIGSSGELHIANVAGDIVITRGGGNEANVEVIKTARGRTDEDARELLDLVAVEFVERNNRAEIRTRYPHGEDMRRLHRRNFNVTVAINVTAPAETRVRAHSVSGNITTKDIKGEVSLESVSGAIRVSNGGRVASAKSISGNVEVAETDIDGPLTASTASGTVVLRRVKARQLEVGSISGSVQMDDVECPRVEAQTVSGDVRYGGVLAKNARYELNSHSGNVQVIVAGGAGFEVEATSFSGAVRSDFPLGAQTDSGHGRGMMRSIRGVYGDGSAVLDLNTFSGNILISKR